MPYKDGLPQFTVPSSQFSLPTSQSNVFLGPQSPQSKRWGLTDATELNLLSRGDDTLPEYSLFSFHFWNFFVLYFKC